MNALIVSGNGQLGKGLARMAPAGVQIVSQEIDTLDITDAGAIAAVVNEVRPWIVFNAAAYTSVHNAESEEAAAGAVMQGGPPPSAGCARRRGPLRPRLDRLRVQCPLGRAIRARCADRAGQCAWENQARRGAHRRRRCLDRAHRISLRAHLRLFRVHRAAADGRATRTARGRRPDRHADLSAGPGSGAVDHGGPGSHRHPRLHRCGRLQLIRLCRSHPGRGADGRSVGQAGAGDPDQRLVISNTRTAADDRGNQGGGLNPRARAVRGRSGRDFYRHGLSPSVDRALAQRDRRLLDRDVDSEASAIVPATVRTNSAAIAPAPCAGSTARTSWVTGVWNR